MTTQTTDTPTLNQSYQFYRFINANPASALATQFVNTLAVAQSQDSAKASVAEINGFFRNTSLYSQVTVDSFLNMAEWLSSSVPPWADFADQSSYFLKLNGSNGMADAGKVLFNQTGGEGGDYSVTYHALDGSKTPLYYREGQLVDDLAADNPAIQLQTSFAALGLFTGDPDDAETPVPVLLGTVRGQQALATQGDADTDAQGQQGVQIRPLIALGLLVIGVITMSVLTYKQIFGGDTAREKRLKHKDSLEILREKLPRQNEPEPTNGPDETGGEPAKPDWRNDPAYHYPPLPDKQGEPAKPWWDDPAYNYPPLPENQGDPGQNDPFGLTLEEKLVLARNNAWRNILGKKGSDSINFFEITAKHYVHANDENKPAFMAFLADPAYVQACKNAEALAKAIVDFRNYFQDYTEILKREGRDIKGREKMDGYKKKILDHYDGVFKDTNLYDQAAVDKVLYGAQRDLERLEAAKANYVNNPNLALEEQTRIETLNREFAQYVAKQKQLSELNKMDQKNLQDTGKSVANPGDIQKMQEQYKQGNLALANQQQYEALSEQIQQQQTMEQNMAILGNDQNLQTAAKQTEENAKKLGNVKLSSPDASQRMTEINLSVNQTQANLDLLYQQKIQSLSKQEQQEINENQDEYKNDQQKDDNAQDYQNSIENE